uniref:Calmodulin-binding protein n=2 Tax=Hordeum vulgare subsp. vulgare TaxID=112509 RepID=A0A8I6XLB3_HORVV
MAPKRPLEVVSPEQVQEGPRSPRKRLRRTVLVVMCPARICMRYRERRRASAATVEQLAQMIRRVQLDIARLFMLFRVFGGDSMSMDRLLVLLDLPNIIQRLLAEQLAALQSFFMVSIQDMVRSTLQTAMQGRQEALVPNVINDPPRHMRQGFPDTGGNTRVKLRFVDVDRPENPLFTGCPVKWQNGENPKVAIFENNTQITQGELSKLQIEILAVNADFFTEQGQEDFTKEQFNKQIYLCKGKDSVLTTVNLANGEAYIGSFFFTESSQRKRLRLTARVKKQDLDVRVQEAITDPFVVQVSRNKANKKSYPPSKQEAVHCLERIAADGKHCQYLAGKSITTVKHFMRHYHIDKSSLQKLTDMKNENWSTLIKHATTSDPGVEIYSYGVAEENIELLFNDFYYLVGMMIGGDYVPVNDLDQLQQHKANNWKKSAYKKFEERESSGGLTPDYFMNKNNGRPVPVREVPLNNDAGPSVQARTTWQYPNDMAAQHEFGDQRPLSVFSRAAILSNNDAGPSNQETLLFPQHTYEQILHQGLGEHGPSIPQNGTPYCLPQENILNDQGQFSAQSTIPPRNFSPVPQDDMITGASLAAQGEGTSSLGHVFADLSSGFPSDQFGDCNGLDLDITEYMKNNGIAPANNADLWNANAPFDGYGHDGGNQ